VTKEYRALCKGLLDEATLQRLREGVELTGGLGRSGPAVVQLEAHGIATTWITLRIDEGKNRQVRRMLLAVGSQVIRLQRTRVGGVTLPEKEDSWRLLTEEEVAIGLGYQPAPRATAPVRAVHRRPGRRGRTTAGRR
jgi:23S rRNA pseudouridine2605 synthase